MPPRLPQRPMQALRPAVTSSAPSHHATQARAFSLTLQQRQTIIPPESPRFLLPADPPQSSELRLPPVRGHLPVPRQIFKLSEDSHKTTTEYIDRTRPRSVAEMAGEAPSGDKDAWRRRMAESRRKSLTSGLHGLWKRKQRADMARRARQQALAEAHRAATTAAEGVDDVLTRSTVRLSTASSTAVAPDPLRFERAKASAERSAALAAARSEARRDALTELYIASKDFIVTEAQLEARVEAEFAADHFPRMGMTIGSRNVWEALGKPVTLSQMVAKENQTSTSVMDSYSNESAVASQRQLKVAGRLTGGKMVAET